MSKCRNSRKKHVSVSIKSRIEKIVHRTKDCKIGTFVHTKNSKQIYVKPKFNDYKPCLGEESTEELIKLVDLNNLPKGIKVSTMTIACKIGTPIHLENVARFIDLSANSIQSVKYGSHPLNNRTIVTTKKKKKKKVDGKSKRNFYNEATVKLKPTNNKPVNVKLFKNESLQLTGVKNMKNFCEIISKLFHELKKDKAAIFEGKLIKKPLVEDKKKLQLYDVQICMINTNFKLKKEIDRDQLYDKLQKDRVNCTYEPCLHACVNIKYQYSSQKKVSVFVFKSGSIIITGANCIDHVLRAYNFIMSKFRKYGNSIILAKIEDLFKPSELNKYLK
jgi:TATA-box binding protein (TBP) (component of TFIID and TFIIIB)